MFFYDPGFALHKFKQSEGRHPTPIEKDILETTQ
jgi:hypothetical protein